MSKRWRAKDVLALADENAVLVRRALERAQNDAHAGLPSGHGDGRGTTNEGGARFSRTESLAISGQVTGDQVRKTMKALVEALERAHRLAESLTTMPEKERQKLLLAPGAGVCANPHCQRWCPGGPDRLRAGRCNKCRMHR